VEAYNFWPSIYALDTWVIDFQQTKPKESWLGILVRYLAGQFEDPSEGQFPAASIDIRSASLTLQVETAVSWIIQQQSVALPRPKEVSQYLLSHSDLIHLVLVICEVTAERLGGKARLSLELYDDPEFEDRYLTLYARQKEYDLSLINTLEELSEEFQEEIGKTSGWLIVTTDFTTPPERSAAN
jgi:hypothetical protein